MATVLEVVEAVHAFSFIIVVSLVTGKGSLYTGPPEAQVGTADQRETNPGINKTANSRVGP